MLVQETRVLQCFGVFLGKLCGVVLLASQRSVCFLRSFLFSWWRWQLVFELGADCIWLHPVFPSVWIGWNWLDSMFFSYFQLFFRDGIPSLFQFMQKFIFFHCVEVCQFLITNVNDYFNFHFSLFITRP